jgi:hypothetical protein
MAKVILWTCAGLCAVHLISMVAIYLSLGRIEVDDVSW